MKLKLYLFDLSRIKTHQKQVVMPTTQLLEYFYDSISKIEVRKELKITDFLTQIFKNMNGLINVGPLTKVENEISEVNEIILSGFNRIKI